MISTQPCLHYKILPLCGTMFLLMKLRPHGKILITTSRKLENKIFELKKNHLSRGNHKLSLINIYFGQDSTVPKFRKRIAGTTDLIGSFHSPYNTVFNYLNTSIASGFFISYTPSDQNICLFQQTQEACLDSV